MAWYLDVEGMKQAERRKYPNLRPLFDDVVRRVEPYFQEGAGLNGRRTDFWMASTIREAHPDLNDEEVHVLARAAMRYYLEK